MTRVLCFGGAVMDFVPAGPDEWRVRAGGSAWNVARVLASLGLSAAFVGTLSHDPFGERLTREGEAGGLDLHFAPRTEAPTALSLLHRTDPAQYMFYAQQAADSQFGGPAAPLWSQSGDQAPAVAAYFGGITLVRDRARAAFLPLAREARARGLTVVYDPNFRSQLAGAYRESFLDYVPLAHLIKVSGDDLTGLMPKLTPAEGLQHLRALNPQATILLTLGEGGARLLTPQADLVHAGYRVPVADTVGAGDASIAALLYATLRAPPLPPPQQLAFALACAAAACTRPGAHAPTLADIHTVQTGDLP
ncbi:PfkB family carbohydrate kinase [Deinococcus sp. QL22]|uniref:PfkB family carbohydrate kinase n=1 Tax=Deinococcus sp. QL22 TaxID=2939437 RepID=UPI0020183810|nr:PfkB family carbohydrate kinase [Deinococcus sp. QL22]UQN08924.1 PfkB family carbohydrate kinase [Deinococcus sp. QL22]